MSIDQDLAPATAMHSAADHPAPRRAFTEAHPSVAGKLSASWHLVRPRSGSQPRYALIES
ncbi:MAG: hypothetical protein LCH96_05080 [Actinobacteria bacterium]|nr:hypothetical protein [Actinomycetota bacterium]